MTEQLTEVSLLNMDTKELSLEKIGLVSQAAKFFFVNPMINYVLPTGFLKDYLANSKSELLKECLVRAGGWRSMELSYHVKEKHADWLDHLAVRWGAMPMALRNRKKLASRVLANLIRQHATRGHVHTLGIGAGTSRNLMEAVMLAGEKDVSATCIDLDSEAFEPGKEIWRESGLNHEAIRFLKGDALELRHQLHHVPKIVKLIGILEYLDDASVQRLLKFSHQSLAEGGSVVTHSIQPKHGVDRFMNRVFNLHLKYRSTEQLIQMLSVGGFGDFSTYSEPIGIYTIIQAQKLTRLQNQ
jgi:SAM-dependent methyltransferase